MRFSTQKVTHPLLILYSGSTLDQTSVAWIADGIVIGTSQLEDIDSISDHIFGLAKALEHDNLIVKVGNGARLIRDRILNQLILHGVETLIVSEYNTSSGSRINAHTKATTRIAMMGGKRVWEIREIEPSEGEIKEIQNESRIFSNGAITISAELARTVACGDLSLRCNQEILTRYFSFPFENMVITPADETHIAIASAN